MAFALLLFGAFSLHAQMAQMDITKIGIVDTVAVFNFYYKKTQLGKEYEKQKAEFQAEVDRLNAEIKQLELKRQALVAPLKAAWEAEQAEKRQKWEAEQERIQAEKETERYIRQLLQEISLELGSDDEAVAGDELTAEDNPDVPEESSDVVEFVEEPFVVTDPAITKLQNEINTKVSWLVQYAKEKNAELTYSYNQLMDSDNFYQAMYNVCRNIAQSKGYTIVMSSQYADSIVWFSDTVDITDLVIENLYSIK